MAAPGQGEIRYELQRDCHTAGEDTRSHKTQDDIRHRSVHAERCVDPGHVYGLQWGDVGGRASWQQVWITNVTTVQQRFRGTRGLTFRLSVLNKMNCDRTADQEYDQGRNCLTMDRNAGRSCLL